MFTMRLRKTTMGELRVADHDRVRGDVAAAARRLSRAAATGRQPSADWCRVGDPSVAMIAPSTTPTMMAAMDTESSPPVATPTFLSGMRERPA